MAVGGFLDVPFPVLGLTGGIAAGKSHVCARLAARGWRVLDADALARRAVEPGTRGLVDLVSVFGTAILAPSGALDRAELGRRVFADPALRARLEALLHPRIHDLICQSLAALAHDPLPFPGAVLDAALWVETGQAHLFDVLWVVEAPLELRMRRLMDRDGFSSAEARARLAAQATDAERALHADQVITNDGRDLEPLLDEALAAFLEGWRQGRERRLRLDEPPWPAGFPKELLETLLTGGGEEGELFLERRWSTALGLEGGRMEDLLSREARGASLRLRRGEAVLSADLAAPGTAGLMEAARELAEAGADPACGIAPSLPAPVFRRIPPPSPVARDPREVPLARKASLLQQAEDLARRLAEEARPGALRQVTLRYRDSVQEVWIARAERGPEGWETLHTADRRVQSVLVVEITAGEGGRLETGYRALGASRGFELFTEEAVEATVREALRLAFQALDALPAPAGTFPVILAGTAGGTLVHEACGHGLEADLVLAGMSVFAGRLGERVASEAVTLIDDGTLPGGRGSAAVDDEGCPTRRVVLIERGVLKGWLHSRDTARRMGLPPTGSGRRESCQHPPIPRMRNTFLAPGPESPEDLLKDMDRGLLVRAMGGGQVDTVTGNFVFQVTDGWWVEGGRVQHPVRNATLAGNGPELLTRITRIAGDLRHFDIGTCGKDGQDVPVSDAQPSLLCPELLVGGSGGEAGDE